MTGTTDTGIAVSFEPEARRDFLIAGAAGERVVVRRGAVEQAERDVVYERSVDGVWSSVDVPRDLASVNPDIPDDDTVLAFELAAKWSPSTERTRRWRSAVPMAGGAIRKADGRCVAGNHVLRVSGLQLQLLTNDPNRNAETSHVHVEAGLRQAVYGFAPSGRVAAVVMPGMTWLLDCAALECSAAK